MPAIHPHINFNGNAEAAFTFYQSVFGGSFSSLVRFKDMAGAGFPVADHEANKIMHIVPLFGICNPEAVSADLKSANANSNMFGMQMSNSEGPKYLYQDE